ELLAQMLRVRLLAASVRGVERMRHVRIGAGIPALIDPVQDAGEAALILAGTQQAIEPAAQFRPADAPPLGGPPPGDLRGVVNAGFQERDVPVELDALHAERRARDGEAIEALAPEDALIGEIVDGEDARRRDALPGEVTGGERAWPIVEVQHIRAPA